MTSRSKDFNLYWLACLFITASSDKVNLTVSILVNTGKWIPIEYSNLQTLARMVTFSLLVSCVIIEKLVMQSLVTLEQGSRTTKSSKISSAKQVDLLNLNISKQDSNK
eukprot:NODE_27_length_33950_cov_0.349739.p19 type:complete len:108 gc:universal NODE_27_length_33950_cov_0.349739:13752-13429(-)